MKCEINSEMKLATGRPPRGGAWIEMAQGYKAALCYGSPPSRGGVD